MRLTVLKDPKITDKSYDALRSQFTDLFQEFTDITPTFFTEKQVWTDYPHYLDNEGDGRMETKYITKLAQGVHKRYSGEGTDHVVFLIHKDNWELVGLWGTNYSNQFYGYQLHICRFDPNNEANSLGTLYHEVMHSFDNFIFTYLGIKIASLIPVPDWDQFCVHGNKSNGGHPRWKYIRHNENTEALRYIASLLKQAYAKREAIYDTKVSMMKRIINLAEQVIVMKRQIINQKVIKN